MDNLAILERLAMPKPFERNDKNARPDGHVFAVPGLGWRWLCTACLEAPEREAANQSTAMKSLTYHLWTVHCWRRVYIGFDTPERAAGIQMALPLLIAHDTQRHETQTQR